MIEFMVIGAPRSGTTWAANWLTTDTTLCLHDPLYRMHYSGFDHISSHKKLGISCTGIMMFPEYLRGHPARKVILHRDLKEINESLEAIGLPECHKSQFEALDSIDGEHVPWTDLFNNPKEIYEYLLQLPFDEERHMELVGIEIQPNFEGLTINKSVTKRLMGELTCLG